jgi:hypothetical protein
MRQALKGRHKRGAEFVAPFQGFGPLNNVQTQGGAVRLLPLRLPWAGLLRAFQADSSVPTCMRAIHDFFFGSEMCRARGERGAEASALLKNCCLPLKMSGGFANLSLSLLRPLVRPVRGRIDESSQQMLRE